MSAVTPRSSSQSTPMSLYENLGVCVMFGGVFMTIHEVLLWAFSEKPMTSSSSERPTELRKERTRTDTSQRTFEQRNQQPQRRNNPPELRRERILRKIIEQKNQQTQRKGPPKPDGFRFGLGSGLIFIGHQMSNSRSDQKENDSSNHEESFEKTCGDSESPTGVMACSVYFDDTKGCSSQDRVSQCFLESMRTWDELSWYKKLGVAEFSACDLNPLVARHRRGL